MFWIHRHPAPQRRPKKKKRNDTLVDPKQKVLCFGSNCGLFSTSATNLRCRHLMFLMRLAQHATLHLRLLTAAHGRTRPPVSVSPQTVATRSRAVPARMQDADLFLSTFEKTKTKTVSCFVIGRPGFMFFLNGPPPTYCVTHTRMLVTPCIHQARSAFF